MNIIDAAKAWKKNKILVRKSWKNRPFMNDSDAYAIKDDGDISIYCHVGIFALSIDELLAEDWEVEAD